MVWVLEYVGISWALKSSWRNAHLQQYPAKSVTWDEAILLVSVGSCHLCGFDVWPVLISSNMPTLRVLLNVFKCPISPKKCGDNIIYKSSIDMANPLKTGFPYGFVSLLEGIECKSQDTPDRTFTQCRHVSEAFHVNENEFLWMFRLRLGARDPHSPKAFH